MKFMISAIIAAMAVAPTTFNFPVEARTLVKGNTTKSGKATVKQGAKASTKNPVKSTKGPGSKSVSSSKMPKSNGKSGKMAKSKSTVVLTPTPTTAGSGTGSPTPITSSPPTESPFNCLTEDILRKLYTSTDGDNWLDNSNWLSGDHCTWIGVSCNNGLVTGLYLNDNALSGLIPTELGCLTSLETLILASNSLTGGIPTELGGLTSLTWLMLYNNSLTGGIPTELGGLTSLTTLYLNANPSLTGGIPTNICNLSTNPYIAACDSVCTDSSTPSGCCSYSEHGC